MDLSVEAEAFGAPMEFSEHEVPTVSGRLVTDVGSIDALRVPSVGTQRSRVFLEAVGLLASRAEGSLVLACMIGPFSLAGRLFGTSEILLATVEEKKAVSLLVAKAAAFLLEYARAFREAGAQGVIIAEPTAGLISPKAADLLSSSYIRDIATALEDDSFQIILHNCGARPNHIASMLDSGASALHLGKMVDIPETLRNVPEEAVVCGNLDPVDVFLRGSPEQIELETEALLSATDGFRNFVVSSGCDIPAHTPLANIQAFVDSVNRHNS
jgi:uroporphyrinogen decarboxylase